MDEAGKGILSYYYFRQLNISQFKIEILETLSFYLRIHLARSNMTYLIPMSFTDILRTFLSRTVVIKITQSDYNVMSAIYVK